MRAWGQRSTKCWKEVTSSISTSRPPSRQGRPTVGRAPTAWAAGAAAWARHHLRHAPRAAPWLDMKRWRPWIRHGDGVCGEPAAASPDSAASVVCQVAAIAAAMATISSMSVSGRSVDVSGKGGNSCGSAPQACVSVRLRDCGAATATGLKIRPKRKEGQDEQRQSPGRRRRCPYRRDSVLRGSFPCLFRTSAGLEARQKFGLADVAVRRQL